MSKFKNADHRRLFVYTMACLTIPIITLGKGHLEISVVSSILAICLFCFDPTFSFYKKNLPNYNFFMKCSFGVGMFLSAIGYAFPNYSNWLLLIWGLPTFLFGYSYASLIDNERKNS